MMTLGSCKMKSVTLSMYMDHSEQENFPYFFANLPELIITTLVLPVFYRKGLE